MTFREELQALINKHSMENGSNTPDFIMAEFLDKVLTAFDEALTAREGWYGNAQPGDVEPPTECEHGREDYCPECMTELEEPEEPDETGELTNRRGGL